MSVITSINGRAAGPFAANSVTLTADDTITYDKTRRQLLVLDNPTGGALTATIDGSTATTAAAPGVGTVDVSAGKSIAVPAGESRCVVLSTISAFCKGVVHITGGTGLKARLINL